MKGRPIDQLVFETMFPKVRQADPQSFHHLLQRHLVVEVRNEVVAFYGHLDTQEAKYPGLDYCHPTHRIRLSRWPWHRKLFKVFDDLRLTPNEIAGLTKWEGTKWAKERFEKEEGITIPDTTAVGFPNAADLEDHPGLSAQTAARSQSAEPEEVVDEEMEAEQSEGELESVGIALNERLRERAARREAGDTSTVLDEEWEQWLKNAIETGELPFLPDQLSIAQQSNDITTVPQAAFFPPSMLNLARAGQWQEIPDFLHELIRRTLSLEDRNRGVSQSPPRSPDTPRAGSSSSTWRRSYSDLRLPSVTSTTRSGLLVQRTAQTPGA